jgi:hypothetical protein
MYRHFRVLTAGAGLAFEKLAPVYIDSDGKVRPATDDSTNELNFDGFAMSKTTVTAACPVPSWAWGLIMEWLEDSDNYTPGTRFYVGATNQLETTGTTPVALWRSMAKKSLSLLLLAYVRQWHKEPIQ